MYIPKRYGQSRIDNCPFCGKIGVTKNSQGVSTCKDHKDKLVENLKCVCGEYLDLGVGKWGPYFRCINCGNINFRKAMEMNPNVKQQTPVQERKEIVVRSDELDFMY
jgi:hypothetical protein